MRCIELYLSVLVVLTSQAVASIGSDMSAEECLAIGYRKSDVSCLRCKELIKFELFSMRDSCLKCCSKETDAEESTKTYSSARLDMCNCKMGAFPQIAAFIKERGRKFGSFSHRHVGGAYPILKLLDSGGRVVDELNIQKW
ncbi:unnamed protein product, partial [Oppiella nova]